MIRADLMKFTGRNRPAPQMYLHLLNPRFHPVMLFRISSRCLRMHMRILSKIFALLNQILFGCDIARRAKIDGGLYLPHPSGVVIGEYVNVGKNCIIHQGVTLGARGEEHELSNPVIGNEVEIGTGAKILGHVRLDDYARIGANAVVLKDVPRGGVAVGIPAKVISLRTGIPD